MTGIVGTLVIVIAMSVYAAGGAAAAMENEKDRARPKAALDDDCDVYSGAYGGIAEDLRRECLQVADDELQAAANRVGAHWLLAGPTYDHNLGGYPDDLGAR